MDRTAALFNKALKLPMIQAAADKCAVLRDRGYEARFVGGFVRDVLIGAQPKDVDIATNATPAQVEHAFSDVDDVNVHDVGGRNYGTLVIRNLNDEFAFEVTSLRKDVITDGRHAIVEFGSSWEEDARRRDFTMNAMSFDPVDQTLYDYFGGQQSIRDRVITFVGDPVKRIAEDYLRIMRMYRFMAVTGFTIGNFIETTQAIDQAKDSLRTQVSKERILMEMSRIVVAPFGLFTLNEMNKHGITTAIFGERIDAESVINFRDQVNKVTGSLAVPLSSVHLEDEQMIISSGFAVDSRALDDFPIRKSTKRLIKWRRLAADSGRDEAYLRVALLQENNREQMVYAAIANHESPGLIYQLATIPPLPDGLRARLASPPIHDVVEFSRALDKACRFWVEHHATNPTVEQIIKEISND